MPHRSQTLAFGEKVVSKVLPTTWEWKESIPELNTMNSALLYSANRYRLRFFLGECVTIMDDKMDYMKTASPVLSQKTKQLDGLMKSPVSVTSMLAHGHGDVCYAHHGLDIFAHDSNYIVGSFAKLL
jgi:hypothetical protein